MDKINFAEPFVGKLENTHIKKAIESKWLGKGEFVNKFEKDFSKIIKSNYCITTNNGTSACLLILMHLKIKPGDEIIIPSMTYISPIHMIKLLGGVPVVVDVDKDTFQIDIKKINKKISKKTKAILIIHNYGGVCDYSEIINQAKKKKITIIEDFSETCLSKIKNKFVGANFIKGLNLISFCSLHSTKTITTGEGGLILTNSKKNYLNISNLRDHGVHKKKAYVYNQVGGNFRLSNILAAIGCAQLKRIHFIMEKKIQLNKVYQKYLFNNNKIRFQKDPKSKNIVKWSFPIKCSNKILTNKIINFLNLNRTIVRPSFKSLDRFKYLNLINIQKNKKNDFINSKILDETVVLLPMHLNLSNSNVKFICNEINRLSN